jgi:hypothetical protein
MLAGSVGDEDFTNQIFFSCFRIYFVDFVDFIWCALNTLKYNNVHINDLS